MTDFFKNLKTALCENPVLRLPDFSKPFVVQPYALEKAVGGVFLQPYKEKLHPVAYFRKKKVFLLKETTHLMKRTY